MLIEVMQAASATTGGLLLTEGSKDKPTMGKVVAVGPGRAPEEEDKPTVAPKVEVGATVLYQKYSGTEVRRCSKALRGGEGCGGSPTACLLPYLRRVCCPPLIVAPVGVTPALPSTTLPSPLQFEGPDDKQYIVVRDMDIMAALA